MSPRCCLRDTEAQAGLSNHGPDPGPDPGPAPGPDPGPAAPGHGLQAAPHTPVPAQPPWLGTLGTQLSPPPGQGAQDRCQGHLGVGTGASQCHPHVRGEAGMGSGIIPDPCGSIPNLSPAWSRGCVTSGWPWSPRGTLGWHCHLQPPGAGPIQGRGWTPRPSPRDEELRVGGWKLLLQNQAGSLESIPKDDLVQGEPGVGKVPGEGLEPLGIPTAPGHTG